MSIKGVLQYVNYLIEKTKEDHPKIDETILKACIVYQYLYIKNFSKHISVEEVLRLNDNEIGLIGPGDNCFTRFLQKAFGWIDFLRTHAILHDAYGRFYNQFGLDRGYCYCLSQTPRFMKASPLCGQISGILYCIFKRLII